MCSVVEAAAIMRYDPMKRTMLSRRRVIECLIDSAQVDAGVALTARRCVPASALIDDDTA